jgi:hypothetical protein
MSTKVEIYDSSDNEVENNHRENTLPDLSDKRGRPIERIDQVTYEYNDEVNPGPGNVGNMILILNIVIKKHDAE